MAPSLDPDMGALLLPACPVRAGVLHATWNAPTTNTDGSPVTSVAWYGSVSATSERLVFYVQAMYPILTEYLPD